VDGDRAAATAEMTATHYEVLLDGVPRSVRDANPTLSQVDRPPTRWESSMQATCDCLAWRGTVETLERRQAEDALGETVYSDFPVHARPTLVAAHLLMDKGIITPAELQAKMAEVRARLERA
jgi:hypothetical protein